MVISHLIKVDLQFVTPGYLPEPGYKKKADAWFIGCPNNINHNTRIWRCDQFNHERALINLGVPRPIISTPKDWGPRMSPEGHVLPPLSETPSPKRRRLPSIDQWMPPPIFDHPFQGRAIPGPILTNQTFWTQPVQPPDSSGHQPTPFTGDSAGSTSGSHDTGAFARDQFKARCQRDTARTLTKSVGFNFARHDRQITQSRAFTPMPNKSNKRANRLPQQPRPHQWAQLSNSLGRRLPLDTVKNLHKTRLEQFQCAIKNKYDETRIITIYLWLNEIKPEIITAYFQDWPQARLEECDLLKQAVLGQVGEHWNRALSLWDEAIDAWREIPVDYPHQYPVSNRTIVVRLAKVNPLTPGLPQSRFSSSHPSTLDHNQDQIPLTPLTLKPMQTFPSTPELALTSSSPNHPVGGQPLEVDSHSPFHPTSPPDQLASKMMVDLTRVPDSPGTGEAISPCPVPSNRGTHDPQAKIPIALDHAGPLGPLAVTSTVAEPLLNVVQPKTTPPQLQKGWPLKSVLVSSLLEWYQNAKSSDMLESWKNSYGRNWIMVPSTVYRYRAWINEVTYDRFAAEYYLQPNAHVGQARNRFREEFNRVA
ncbi:uncharacterized protein MELLADRAFT_68712 [Melampsora larici-populina 98AG31]|uniref:Uncharacterized protein n=1 Tax=Melampsora larici-populina (strain 98AG31 / pathotype 3-4-7) TaxID=747676 RepID=F4S7X2_MELLP|nr:uncharacterized protein MELLADRAFT_68712 [Melampsora larici-populina 98AG31]EGF99287.1 hypothetical protein MELLADRAFT_68712 [Melampsora larici-populina 98AG31]